MVCFNVFVLYIYIYIYIHTHTHTHTHIYIYIYLNLYVDTHIYIIECLLMVWETGFQSHIDSYQRFKKWYLMPLFWLGISISGGIKGNE